MKTITKKQFVRRLATKTEKPQATCSRVLDGVLATLADFVAEDNKVTFVGFGTFSLQTKEEHEVRNPRTGEMMNVPAKKSMKFKCGSVLKERLNH